MDVTTLALAVDSTQVNSASQALRQMAAEGFKAESVVAKLANTAQLQGRALNTGIVKNAQAAADSIKGLTGATSSLSSARDFSATSTGLAAAAAEANTATNAVKAFGAAIAASAAAGAGVASAFQVQAPKAATVQQIAQAPVSVLARQAAPAAVATAVDSQPTVAAANALDKFADQATKAKAAAKGLTDAAQEQAGALGTIAPSAQKAAASVQDVANSAKSLSDASGVGIMSSALTAAAAQANATAAAIGNAKAQAAKSSGNFNAFSGLGVTTKQVEELGKTSQLSGYKAQQLSYQLNDLFVQIASGQSPITALIQQGSQLNGTFGGIGGTLGALKSVLTPFNIGIAAAAAAVGTFGYAQYQASQQSKAFKDATVLTGNFAGQTEEKFGEMANRIAESTKTSVSSVREMATALARTGQIGPEVFDAATEAAVRYAKTTGKAMDEVAGDVANSFAQMAKNPLKFVDDQNKGGANLFSAADRDQVKKLQDQGKLEEASALVLQKWGDNLKKLGGNVGDFGKLIDEVKTKASQFVDFLGQMKFPSAVLAGQAGLTGDALILPPTSVEIAAAEVEAQRKGEEEKARKAREQAVADSKSAKIRQDSTAAAERLDNFNVRANPAEGRQKATDLLNKDIADAAAGGKTYTAAQIARMRLQNQLDTADPRVLQNANVNYSSRIQSFKDALDKEQAALAFHNQFQQNLYQAGAASLDKLYDTKVENIRKGVTAEVNELDKEKAATQELLKSVIEPAQRMELQARIKRFDVEKGKVRDKGRYDESLTEQERAAAQRSQADAVDNFRANLKQSGGDEFGAALLRAQVAERQNRVIAGQSGGKITDEDVARQTALTKAAAEFNDVQRQAGFLAQSAARAQEATFMAADLGGKSLRETEDAIYAVRARELEQLGALAAKAAELAKESTRPEVKQYAADLALAYAKAAAAVDPALNRLREAQKELASGIANTLNQGIATLPQAYSSRRQEVNQEVKDDKDRYNRRIDNLESYLANATAKTDRARIQQKIKDLEAERDRRKGESKGSSLLKAANENILQPMASSVFSTVNKLIVTDPLQKYIEGQLKGLTEGNGAIAKSLKDALGIKDVKVDPKVAAEQAAATATDTLANAVTSQTSAVQASTLALEALANAANSAAGVAGGGNSKPLTVEPGSAQAAPSMGDFTRADRALSASSAPADNAAAQAAADARQAVEGFSGSTMSAARDVSVLASAAGKGSGALGLLPSIVNTVTSAMNLYTASLAAASASNSAKGGGDLLAAVFGKTGASATAGTAGSDAITSYYFHSGGVVGGPARIGSVSSSIFAGAPRYHTGGIAGQKADGARAALAAAALKHGEVPAILMKNEEVLRRDDPRHRANLGSEVFAKLMQSKGENSTSVLQGLLSRLGVKDEPATSALKVAGARELGGPVSAGKLYRVNEKRPELLNVGNKQYLMMGAQGGSVDPNPGARGQGGNVQHLNVTVAMPQGGNANTANQFGVIAGRQMQNALRRNG